MGLNDVIKRVKSSNNSNQSEEVTAPKTTTEDTKLNVAPTIYYGHRLLSKHDTGEGWICVKTDNVISPKRRSKTKNKVYPKVNAKYRKEFISPYLSNEPVLMLENKHPEYTEKQKEYQSRVYSINDIRRRTEDVYRAKKGRGFARYTWVNEFMRCKNGMLYYLIPLISFLVAFMINWFYVDFLANAIVASVAMCILLPFWKTLTKKDMRLVVRILTLLLLIVIGAAALILLTQLDALQAFYAKIDWWFTLKLFFLIINIYYFASFYVLFGIAYAQDCAISRQHARVMAGEPGSGKTSRAVHEGYMMAVRQWNLLKFEFWMMHSQRDDIYASGDKLKILHYKKLEESVNFYNEHPDKIPCLWSTFTITDYTGRTSYDITIDHIRAIEPLPQFPVIVFDELGAVLKNEFSNTKATWYDVSDFARLIRHWYEGFFYGCEQDYNNIYIDFRRVVGENVLISCTEWVHKPVMLNFIYETLKYFKFDNLDKKIKSQRRYAKFLSKLEKFVKSIGFRKQYYKSICNVQTNATVSEKNDKFEKIVRPGTKVRIMPAMLSADYDERQYFFTNPSIFDKSIKYEEKRSKTQINLDYDRQYVSKTEKTEEKRNSQNEQIETLLKEDWNYNKNSKK